jgi:hypothetical protein
LLNVPQFTYPGIRFNRPVVEDDRKEISLGDRPLCADKTIMQAPSAKASFLTIKIKESNPRGNNHTPDLEITYRLEIRDLRTAYQYLYKINRTNQLVRIAAYTICTIIVIQNLMVLEGDLLSKVISGLIALGIFWFSFQVLTRLITFLSIQTMLPKDKSSGVLGDHRIQISSEHLFESTRVNQTYHQWVSVKQIRHLPKHLLILFKNNHFHIIPKQAFATPDACQQFCDAMELFINTASQDQV